MILLTSFKRYHANDYALAPLPGYSIAVYQPRWFPQLPKLDVFDIRDAAGQWVRPRNFIPDFTDYDNYTENRPADPVLLQRYHDTLAGMYRERTRASGLALAVGDLELARAVYPTSEGRDIALCCWCPYDKAAKRQIESYGSFVCHSWPVETVLCELGYDVVRDADRQEMVS